MNKVILIGNLTRDPELSTTQGGSTVCKFGLAVNRRFSNQAGERDVDFFNIVTWNKLAETCNKFLRKGRKAAITGRVEIRTYEQEGVKKSVTDIIADDVEFLSPAGEGGAGGDYTEPALAPVKKKTAELTPLEDENLPF
ncbi:single-stranded DNA-binding protein [Clostridia bacterium]|nr:single-stranded DNA-binding protein [Clostridia bacterium]